MGYELLTLVRPASVSIDDLSSHCRTRKEFIQSVKQVIQKVMDSGQPAAVLQDKLFQLATDAKMLREAWDYLARRGGQAPGPDKLRYTDLDDHEVWSLLTAVSKALRDGTFRRGKVGTVFVPKDILNLCRGNRVISLLSIVARVVQRAIADVLQVLIDPLFGTVGPKVAAGERIFGFRQMRGRLHALAVAEHFAAQQKRKVWVTEDIRNAFDNVPLGRLRDVLMIHIPCPTLADLIVELVRTDNAQGIQQGGPLSPMLLNLYLHHFLDSVWRTEHPTIPLLRYADDILLLCRSRKEAAAARAALKKVLLPTGMLLKHQTAKTAITRIGPECAVTWLGFDLRWSGTELLANLPGNALQRLRARFRSAHEHPNAPVRAVAMLKGWLIQIAPCYNTSNRPEILKQIRQIAESEGYDELPRYRRLDKWWSTLLSQWHEVRAHLKPSPQIPAVPLATVISPSSGAGKSGDPPFDPT